MRRSLETDKSPSNAAHGYVLLSMRCIVVEKRSPLWPSATPVSWSVDENQFMRLPPNAVEIKSLCMTLYNR